MKRTCNFILVLLLFCGCKARSPNQRCQNGRTDIKKFISSLLEEERILLEYFFRSLIQEDTIGYVLLGGKPMGFHSYVKPNAILPAFPRNVFDKIDLFFDEFDPNDGLFERSFEVWKKYEHLFCGNNIFFDVFEQNGELRCKKVSVFNKRQLLQVLELHFHRFRELDHTLTIGELFDALLHDQHIKNKFYSRDDLVGICLGYGEHNAILFRKRSIVLNTLGRLGFTVKNLPSIRRNALEKKLEMIDESFNGRFIDHASRKLLFHVGVGFLADFSDPETNFLQKKYAELHTELTNQYSKPDFLSTTLELIVQADSEIN
jgi:hypothetical protein